MSRNAAFADALEELADRLEADDVAYKPQMYRTAAANLRDHPDALETLVAEERVTDVDGVGDSIAAKAAEFVDRGTFDALERERERLPVDIAALAAVEGLGPKRVQALYEALSITDLDELEAAAEAGEIAEVDGFGERTQATILERVEFARRTRERTLLGEARPLADALLAALAPEPAVEEAAAAGSLRRWKETIGDVDLLVASERPERVVTAFTDLDRAAETLEAGTSKASVRADGIRVDLRVVDPAEWGAALQYFTGSREHNIRLRNAALERDLKVNEYGVFDVSGVTDPDAGQRVGERVAGATEADVYDALGLPYVEPELREDAGELDAARAGELPTLVTADDLRGDLHVHTDASDGRATLAEMAAAAAAADLEYLVVADHAAGPGVVGDAGLDDAALRDHAAAVRAADADAPVTLLAGVEVNVDADGDVVRTDDGLLADLDCVVASPHSALGAEGDVTDRLVRAVEHPHVDVLGHPTGRLLNRREGLTVDAGRLGAAAAAADTALEVNANPARLDLGGGQVRAAVEAGATVAVNTDAHGPGEFDNLRYGVHTARRGWAEAADVLNTRSVAELRTFLEA